jgi:hypothetical protein
LEAAQEIVGEDAQVLPGAVRPVVMGRHHVEGELAFELRRSFPGPRGPR